VLVATWYPPSARLTHVTVVCVRTGALETTLYCEMKSITSPIVM
jgi:hypothetical protein